MSLSAMQNLHFFRSSRKAKTGRAPIFSACSTACCHQVSRLGLLEDRFTSRLHPGIPVKSGPPSRHCPRFRAMPSPKYSRSNPASSSSPLCPFLRCRLVIRVPCGRNFGPFGRLEKIGARASMVCTACGGVAMRPGVRLHSSRSNGAGRRRDPGGRQSGRARSYLTLPPPADLIVDPNHA